MHLMDLNLWPRIHCCCTFSLLYLTSYLGLGSWSWFFSGSPPEAGATDESLQRRLEDLDRSFVFPQSALGVQLSTARAGLSYCPEARAFLQAEQPISGGQYKPSRDTKYQVFRDLRGRGFYLTSAGKFGGDFLVYPGESVATGPSFTPNSQCPFSRSRRLLCLSCPQVTLCVSTPTSSPCAWRRTRPFACWTSWRWLGSVLTSRRRCCSARQRQVGQ